MTDNSISMQMPSFNWQNFFSFQPNFNNWSNFNPSFFSFQPGSWSSDITGNGVLSEEEKQRKIQEYNEQIAAKEDEIKKLDASEVDLTPFAEILGDAEVKDVKTTTDEKGNATTVASLSNTTAALKQRKSELENAKVKSDGQVVLYNSMEEHKKKPWYKKLGRAAGNMVQGAWKLCTNFVGYEDGKWNWKKCLKNVAIAGAAIGACAIPGVGPAISTVLIASGVAAGAVGVTKGIVKATKAETEEELDNAFQDIGAGTAIGLTSALGVRGLGKGLRMTSATASESSATGIIGKLSNVGRDMTVNAFKATVRNSKLSSGALKTTISNSGAKTAFGKNVGGFFKSWGSNLKQAVPIRTKTKLKQQQEVLEQNLNFRQEMYDAKLAEIGLKNRNNNIAQYIIKRCPNLQTKNPKLFAKLQGDNITGNMIKEAQCYLDSANQGRLKNILINRGKITPQGKIIEQERLTTELQLQEVHDAKTITNYREMNNNSFSSTQKNSAKDALAKLKNGEDTIFEGIRLRGGNKSDIAALERSIERMSDVTKQVQKLCDLKMTLMRRMALKKDNKSIVKDFNNGTELGRIEAQRKLRMDEMSKKKYFIRTPLKAVWDAMAIAFKPWEVVSKTPAGAEYRIQQVIVPEYETFMFADTMDKATRDAALVQIAEIQKNYLEAQQQLEKELLELRQKKCDLMCQA